MNDGESILVAQPEQSDALVLIFHGVGATAAGMRTLGEAIARARPRAVVACIASPNPSTLGQGREWFSVVGITEQSRPERIAAAMPAFRSAVAKWQARTGLSPDATTLIGFSQGAIMSLESTQDGEPSLASRVIAIAGRFAAPVRVAPKDVHFHFVHGTADGVIDPRFASEAVQQLKALGSDAVLDRVVGLGHGIDARALSLVLQALSRR